MDIEGIILSKISHKRKKTHMISLICAIEYKSNKLRRQNKKLIDKTTEWWLLGGRQ